MGMNMAVTAIQGVVTKSDTAAKALFTLPPGSVPLQAVVQVETAFNDSGTDLLELGIGTDPDYFADDIDVSAVGAKIIAINRAPNLTAQTGFFAKYTGQNGNSTTGRARVTLVYATPFDPS